MGDADEGYVPKKRGPLRSAKIVRVQADDDAALAKKLDTLNDQLSRSLAEQEEQKRATLEQSMIKHREVSGKVKGLYDQATDRYAQLVKQERMLSSQAGQLLNGLQREEAHAGMLSNTVRKIRHTRKKLLTRISAPRWEVPHHFHMTCIEHVLGHSQPHVLEVGQMIPGHLRIFCFARVNTLIQKSLIFSLNRTKTARFGFSDKLKEVYRSLQLTRAEIKEQEKMLQMMREKSHLMPEKMADPREVERALGSRSTEAQAIRTRYLNSLYLSQNYLPEVQELPGADAQPEERQEWKQVLALLGDLENHSATRAKASEELVVLESCRERFKVGLDSVPRIVGFDSARAASMADADDALMEQQMETLAESTDKSKEKREGEPLTAKKLASGTLEEDMQKLFVNDSTTGSSTATSAAATSVASTSAASTSAASTSASTFAAAAAVSATTTPSSTSTSSSSISSTATFSTTTSSASLSSSSAASVSSASEAPATERSNALFDRSRRNEVKSPFIPVSSAREGEVSSRPRVASSRNPLGWGRSGHLSRFAANLEDRPETVFLHTTFKAENSQPSTDTTTTSETSASCETSTHVASGTSTPASASTNTTNDTSTTEDTADDDASSDDPSTFLIHIKKPTVDS